MKRLIASVSLLALVLLGRAPVAVAQAHLDQMLR